jgi:hypothetical protein
MKKETKKAGLSEDVRMLSEIIGREATVKLILNLGGVYVYVPKVSGVIIKELHESGQSIDQIAGKAGFSKGYVSKQLENRKEIPVTNDGLNDVCRIIAGIIGRDAVIRLSLAWGGSSLYIPKPTQEIIKEVYQNTDLHPIQIAALCHCSLRTVYRSIEGLPLRNKPTGKNAAYE